jgi:tetratricopeptide (TPR) repeat protein
MAALTASSAATEPLQLRMTATSAIARTLPAGLAATPGNAASTTTPSAAAGAESANSSARQAQAGREALTQAQALWSAGSHDAAIELLQQALALAERSSPAGATQPLLASMARELGRMLLADGRAAATLELLTRLEPALGREADIWALRGNAAQRLGRHPDSVRAYNTALQLRPGEQRWLLGAAVSLAALGQTAQASEMVDKARALGPVSKDVLAYLRQAGVPTSAP